MKLKSLVALEAIGWGSFGTAFMFIAIGTVNVLPLMIGVAGLLVSGLFSLTYFYGDFDGK